MTEEISIQLFERNAKIYNKKGLRRKYSSIAYRQEEYLSVRPLGVNSKYVLEVEIDKEYGSDFQQMLKQKGYKILGKNNDYHIENILKDYHENEELYVNLKEKMLTLENEYVRMKEESSMMEINENGDAIFYFLPYNDKVSNLCEFVEEEKNDIISYAKKNDITVVMRLCPYIKLAEGFLAFNFLDEIEEDKVNDYFSNLRIYVDFQDRVSVYIASVLLSGITENEEDLEMMNCHIIANNLKYTRI